MRKTSKPNVTQQKRLNQQTMDFYAALAGKPTIQLAPVAPPREKPKGPRAQPTEHQEQVRVIHWWRSACNVYGLSEKALFAIPNGGKRDMIEAVHLRSEGVRAGIPDLFLAEPSGKMHGLFVEMKSTVGRPSAEQMEWIGYAQTRDYVAVVAYGADEAIAMIKDYLGPI